MALWFPPACMTVLFCEVPPGEVDEPGEVEINGLCTLGLVKNVVSGCLLWVYLLIQKIRFRRMKSKKSL